MKFCAVFDFYTSVNAYSDRCRYLEVFCHVLTGNLDKSCLNYILYMAEILEEIDWLSTEDIGIFFQIIYPNADVKKVNTK
jgi:hypothetical protein